MNREAVLWWTLKLAREIQELEVLHPSGEFCGFIAGSVILCNFNQSATRGALLDFIRRALPVIQEPADAASLSERHVAIGLLMEFLKKVAGAPLALSAEVRIALRFNGDDEVYAQAEPGELVPAPAAVAASSVGDDRDVVL